MQKILVTVFSGVLFLGAAAAQDSATPAPGSPASDPQTSAPQTQPQSPESQTPATQSSPESSAPRSTQTPQTGANATAATGARRIAPGSVIPVLLTKTIDAKKAKTGDEVVAKVTQDLKTNSGEVIVSKDTKILGHVTEAQAHSKEQKESQVGIAFDRAVEKNGNEMQLPMSIQAIIGPQNNGPQNNGSPNNSGGAGNEAAPPSSASTATPSGSSGGRSAGMGGSAPSPTPSPSTGGSNTPADTQNSARPPITAETQGVVGISNLKLESAGQANLGSVVSSEKNNVKLESGTMMLLRVNQ